MKKIIAILLAAVLLLSLAACGGKTPMTEERPAEAPEEEATPDDGYVHITTAEEFCRISDDLGGKYILDASIDSRDMEKDDTFRPIGSADAPFTGELNGNGYAISGMLEYTGQDEAWGLFACNDGSIHDLTLRSFQCDGLSHRYYEFVDDDWGYSSDTSGLPVDSTQNYGVLCGINRGVIEDVVFDDGSVPDLNLLQNDNETMNIGLVCGRNEGTIRGIELKSMSLCFRTVDKDTAVSIGGVCGLLTGSGVMEDITVSGVSVILDCYPYLNTAPAVNAGGIIGEMESGAALGRITQPDGRSIVSAFYSLADAEMCMGGLVGLVRGDIELAELETHTNVYMDLRDDAEGYEPSAATYACGGGLIGRAEGSVTVSDCTLREMSVTVCTREGGHPLYSAAGGIVGFCGGDLSVSAVTLPRGTNAEIDSEGRDTYFGGLCGYCAGSSSFSDTQASIAMGSYFYDGYTLYQSNILGYAQGEAGFTNVKTDCGDNELQAVAGDAESVFYLAALAGCAENGFTAEGCEVDVHYNAYIGEATLHDGSEGEGLYNPLY